MPRRIRSKRITSSQPDVTTNPSSIFDDEAISTSTKNQSDPNVKKILLWGDTQVGKTSLLASSFNGNQGQKFQDELPKIDMSKSFDDITRHLLPAWQKLSQGCHTEGTTTMIPLAFETYSGNQFIIQDIKGGDVHSFQNNPEMAAGLKNASCILFLVEWDAVHFRKQFNAIESVFPFFSDSKSFGLIFTKADRGLAFESEDWNAPRGWWKKHSWLQGQEGFLERFEDNIWPISCYGFQDDGRVSVTIGECGLLIPYKIKPYKVLEPLIWAVKKVLH